jgi:hypothetical protein
MDGNVAVGVGIVYLFTLFIFVWAFVSVLKQPSWAYEQAGKSKALWVLLLVVGLFVPFLGLVVCMWYLMGVNPRVRAQAHLDQRIGFPGGAAQY